MLDTYTKGVTQNGLLVTLAGTDITAQTDENSISINDSLGQGAGSGSGSKSKASNCSFLTTLGPLSTAVGAASMPGTPQLVRAGEVVIYDKDGARVFGGFATKLSDETNLTTVRTRIDCHDYWQMLDRTLVVEVFSGMTDVAMLRELFTKYEPSIDLSLLPATGSVFFATQRFRNFTLLKAVQTIVDRTGFAAWIDPYKRLHYAPVNQSQTAPFSLSNDPNFVTSFQYGVDQNDIDDNAVISRVHFIGGKRPSNDFAQDISTQANGANKVFVLAYYPRDASDGKIHVTVNAVELKVGFAPGSTPANKLISEGGTADVLVNPDAKTLTFNSAPAGGTTVICTYRHQIPLVVVVKDKKSFNFFGRYFDGTVSDDTVLDPVVAVQRARVLLFEQSFGLRVLKVRTWKAGLQAGQLLRVVHSIRGIDGTFLVQSVETRPKGAGVFEYTVSLGAWNWDLVDLLAVILSRTQPQDNNTEEEVTIVETQEVEFSAAVTFEWESSIQFFGGYFARDIALADGHDAYSGRCSITE